MSETTDKKATIGPTPGPWIVDEVNTPNGVSYFISHLWDGEVDGDDESTHTDQVAEVVMDYHGDRSLCNARLLAAAPALVEALKELLPHATGDTYSTDINSKPTTPWAARDKAGRAIALASPTNRLKVECTRCGSASGPLRLVDADCAGWICGSCYSALQDEIASLPPTGDGR